MALSSYIRGGAKAVKKGISTAGSYLLKPVDAWIEKDKKIQAAKREANEKLIRQNFGSVEAYEKLQEEERMRTKKNLEAKQKGTPAGSYVKKR